jgi:hypothetical protein
MAAWRRLYLWTFGKLGPSASCSSFQPSLLRLPLVCDHCSTLIVSLPDTYTHTHTHTHIGVFHVTRSTSNATCS